MKAAKPRKPTATQLAIIRNVAAGRVADYGRAYTQAASAGWGQSRWSCIQRGWIVRDGNSDVVTPEGRAIAGLDPA